MKKLLMLIGVLMITSVVAAQQKSESYYFIVEKVMWKHNGETVTTNPTTMYVEYSEKSIYINTGDETYIYLNNPMREYEEEGWIVAEYFTRSNDGPVTMHISAGLPNTNKSNIIIFTIKFHDLDVLVSYLCRGKNN